MSQRQKRSPQGLKCKDSWNCYHTIYPNYTDAAHSYRRNSQIVPFKVTRPVVQKFRLGHHWDRMNIVASLIVKVQPSAFQID